MVSWRGTEARDYQLSYLEDLTYVNDCVNNNTVPKKPVQASPQFCAYCNYKALCNAYADEEVYKE